MEYLRILGSEITAGGASTRPREWRARPLSRGPLVAPSTYASTHTHTHFIFYPKNPHPAQARVLAHFAAIFDLLAQSSIHKTALGDCCFVCDSPIGPISFVLVLYSLQIFAA